MGKPIDNRWQTFHQRNRPDEAFNHLPDHDRTTEDLEHERSARRGTVRRRQRELAGVRSTQSAMKRRRNSGQSKAPAEKRAKHPGERRSSAGYKAQEKALKKSIRNQERRIREIDEELTRRDEEYMPNV